MQSNYLLNLRLEADNCTLLWSKPAWDIVNTWNTTNIINSNSPNTATNSNNLSANNGLVSLNSSLNQKSNNLRASIANNSLFTTLETSAATITAKSESLRKKLALASSPPQTHSIKFHNSPIEYHLKYATIGTPGVYTNNLKHIKEASSVPIVNTHSNGQTTLNDHNLKYSIGSLIKHYTQHDYANLDCVEGYLDLNFVKHIRLGCLDSQALNNMQQIARKYAIMNFDQTNVITIVYGNSFPENK